MSEADDYLARMAQAVPSNRPEPVAVETQKTDHPPPDEFFDERGIVPARLGDYIAGLGNIRLGVDGRLWRYKHGVYLPDGEDFTRRLVRHLLGERFRKRHVEETAAWLRATDRTVSERPPERWLNCTNGLLDWRTGELRPHTPDIVSTVQLPIPWNPDARCPRVDAFLADVIPEDARALIYELAGYLLYPGNPLRRAVLLLGPGRNGKSVLLGVLKALLGQVNVSSIPLQTLGEHRFAGAELFGRLANISGDLDARAIKQTDLFKMATGGDAILAERKYGHSFSFTPFATFVFAANEPPLSSDQTAAWFDRWLIIPMDRRLREDRVDPHLLGKLTAPTEISGLLVRAVEGLRTLMDRGRFAETNSIKAAGAAYRSRLDTVAGFVDECCVLEANAWTPRPKLYEQYTRFTKEGGRHALSRDNLYDHLRRNHPGEITEKTRNGIRGFAGIGLQAEQL